MAHKTLVGGTAYDTKGGRCLVNGTGYSIKKGRTLMNGTGYDINFTAVLGTMKEGDIVLLNENGSLVEFYVAKHNYESGLNGSGRTLVVRKDCYDSRQWNSTNKNAYAESAIDIFLNGEYKALLDADIQSAIGTTTFYYTIGNGDNNVTTLTRSIFLLSSTELGGADVYNNVEGSVLPIYETLNIAYLNGNATTQWTRTPDTTGTSSVRRLNAKGTHMASNANDTNGSRPAFTLPSTLVIGDDGVVSIS